MYARVVESLHATRHSSKYQRPRRMIIPLLSAGTDPTKIFILVGSVIRDALRRCPNRRRG